MLTPGTTLQDRYLIERLLDRSPLGDLYLARDQRTEQPVDVKAITRTEPDIDALFAREAAALVSLRHPALPAVVDMFAAPLGRFVVFDHIPGLTLEDVRVRSSEGRLSAEAAIRLVQPVLDALDQMHRHPARLAHRDVRLANIRVTTAGQVYLINPGVAGQSGAPFTGNDPHADLYGIGAVLYTLLTGVTPPHPAERLQRDTLQPVRQIRADLPPELAQAIQRLLSLDPVQQYASAADAHRALTESAPNVVCPRCSKQNRASARFCRSCGAPLPASDPRSAIRAFIEQLPSQPVTASPADTTAAASPFDFPPSTAPTVITPPHVAAAALQSDAPAPPPVDAPTVTTPPAGVSPPRGTPAPPSRVDPGAAPLPGDAPTVISPPGKPPVETTANVSAAPVPAPPTAGAPPVAPVGSAQQQRGWLIGGIIAAIVLLLACAGGSYFALGAVGLLTGGATAVSGGSPAPPETRTPATGGSAATAEARQNATATAIAAAQRATATARAEGQTATAQAGQAAGAQTETAIARQTVAAAAQQTAAAIAAATQTAAVPTATPMPQALIPQPGTLSLADYQAQTRGLRQLLFETFDRGERTKAIWRQEDNERRRAALRDNLYYLTVKTPDLITWYTWERNLGNAYNIELSVAFQTVGAPASVGIAFDVQSDSNSGLFFEITNDKRWSFTTVVNGEVVSELSTALIPEDVVVDGVGTNTLWVVRTPNEIQLWINSKHVATVPPSPFPGG
ncbi:MAG: zinc-ribbon domain-containing protein, partial [Roseiflexus sp.]|nr:zinc-ribbon domain-containing protein [Roseiflexus sp.]